MSSLLYEYEEEILMNKVVKGIILGSIAGFLVGESLPDIPYPVYDAEIKTLAVSSKIMTGVCPNSVGASSLRDSYLSTVTNVAERAYILSSFDYKFSEACKNINIPVSSPALPEKLQ